MIEWKAYGQTRETQPESHVPLLISNGTFVKIGVHQLDVIDRVYRWFDNNGYNIAGVTHYAVIGLPEAIVSTEPPQPYQGLKVTISRSK